MHDRLVFFEKDRGNEISEAQGNPEKACGNN